MAIKLISVKKIKEINQPEKPIIITYKTWGEFNKNIGKDIKVIFPEIEKKLLPKRNCRIWGVREEK